MSIPANVLEETPDIGGLKNSRFISGVARLNNEMIIILDIDKLLTEEEKIELSGIVENV